VIPSNRFVSDSSDIPDIPSMIQHERLLSGVWKMGHPVLREVFSFRVFLENVFSRKDGHQEVINNYQGAGKWIFLEKCLKLRPQSQG
jgi:hypothetical protein